MNKIVFAIADAGSGHRSVASAIQEELNTIAYASFSCEIIEFFKDNNLFLLKHTSAVYGFIIRRFNFFFSIVYWITNSLFIANVIASLLYIFNRKAILSYIHETDPQMFVVANPVIIGRLLSLAKRDGGFSFNLITLITDPITVHKFWITPKADLHIVFSQSAFDFVSQFIDPEYVQVANFPVHRKFYASKYSIQQLRTQLGISEDQLTILITGGKYGMGYSIYLVEYLQKFFPDLQILCVAGINEKKYRKLQQRLTKTNVQIFRYVENLDILMAASDIVITKAGPSTIYECIALNKWLIVTQAVGLQEIGNLSIVRDYERGCYAPTLKLILEFIEKVKRVVDSCADNKSPNFYSIEDIGSLQVAKILLNQFTSSPKT